MVLTRKKYFLFPTLIPLSGTVVGTTCFSSCCDKDSAIIFTPAACLTSTLLETGMGARDCKCSRDQQLNVSGIYVLTHKHRNVRYYYYYFKTTYRVLMRFF
jgi:hypothetical protein